LILIFTPLHLLFYDRASEPAGITMTTQASCNWRDVHCTVALLFILVIVGRHGVALSLFVVSRSYYYLSAQRSHYSSISSTTAMLSVISLKCPVSVHCLWCGSMITSLHNGAASTASFNAVLLPTLKKLGAAFMMMWCPVTL